MRLGKKKRLDVGNRVVKQVITGSAIPKSLAFIELEKNYAMLAHMMNGMIDRMLIMENKMEKMEKRLVHILSSKKLSRL